jgi:hypothetical protein
VFDPRSPHGQHQLTPVFRAFPFGTQPRARGPPARHHITPNPEADWRTSKPGGATSSFVVHDFQLYLINFEADPESVDAEFVMHYASTFERRADARGEARGGRVLRREKPFVAPADLARAPFRSPAFGFRQGHVSLESTAFTLISIEESRR